MPFELHTWGRIGDLSSFDADCLIAVLYLKLVASPVDYVVIPSSNPLISSCYELPCVREDGAIVASGLFDVLRFFKARGFEIDAHLSLAERAQCTALTTFIHDNLSILSLYIQRLHPQHFQDIFRPGIIELVTFPVQYVAPMWLFNKAKSRVAHIHDVDFTNKDAGSESKVPGVSFLKKQSVGYSSLNEPVPRGFIDRISKSSGGTSSADFKAVLKMIGFACECLPSIELALLDSETDFVFGDRPSLADIFLIVHLAVETLPKYSTSFIKDLVEVKYSGINQYLNKHMDLVLSDADVVGTVQSRDQLTLKSLAQWSIGY